MDFEVVRARLRTTAPVAVVLAMVLVGAVACGPKMIDGTEVEDTPDARAIYEVVQAYRKAIEERDVPGLAAIVSSRYFENASTVVRSDDDYGYEALREKILPLLQDNIKTVQYRVRLTRIEIDGDRAHADFEFWLKFLYSEGGREGWRVKNDFDRLDFEREAEGWKITGGL